MCVHAIASLAARVLQPDRESGRHRLSSTTSSHVPRARAALPRAHASEELGLRHLSALGAGPQVSHSDLVWISRKLAEAHITYMYSTSKIFVYVLVQLTHTCVFHCEGSNRLLFARWSSPRLAFPTLPIH